MLLVLGAGAQLSDDLSREQLKPLTAFRQQHRRLVRFLIQVIDSWVQKPSSGVVCCRSMVGCAPQRSCRTSCNKAAMAFVCVTTCSDLHPHMSGCMCNLEAVKWWDRASVSSGQARVHRLRHGVGLSVCEQCVLGVLL